MSATTSDGRMESPDGEIEAAAVLAAQCLPFARQMITAPRPRAVNARTSRIHLQAAPRT